MEQSVGKAVLLKEDSILLDGSRLIYRLECVEKEVPNFQVQILYRGESGKASLGFCLESALDAFKMLVCGRVTPCTLDDIIADWEEEEQIF